ncbi:hypothetical protein HRbin02_01897 [Candidatus Calditenuaceae archaeon HR02]|nr:hypothetical protein HRbin02_01897 [Candidatus Calditenuaceae archaeon HR02]
MVFDILTYPLRLGMYRRVLEFRRGGLSYRRIWIESKKDAYVIYVHPADYKKSLEKA